MEATIIRNTGNSYVALTEDGTEVSCRAKGNFKIKGLRTTNPVAVGDRVVLSFNEGNDNAYITRILPRKNYIIRRASNLSKESHILAANIDQAVLVMSLSHPTTSLTFVDRFLATAEAYRIPALIVINKIDLLEAEDKELLDAVDNLYQSIGYEIVNISARENMGIDILADRLNGKVSLISGNSGVGKSTLINRLIPGLNLKTAEISDAHDQGIHTTTYSEMFFLPAPLSGAIIDTPGIRGFGTIDMDRYEISHFFPEIFRMSGNCRFGNCTHTHEPGCAVVDAVENGYISQSRYGSYLSILEDTDHEKYRKAF